MAVTGAKRVRILRDELGKRRLRVKDKIKTGLILPYLT